jgi:hypothetical protein
MNRERRSIKILIQEQCLSYNKAKSYQWVKVDMGQWAVADMGQWVADMGQWVVVDMGVVIANNSTK